MHAKCLFEFDKKLNKKSIQKKRICERKIIVILASSNEEAYEIALNYGREDEFSFEDDGLLVCYNFIGITELISLADEDDEVVWWAYEEKLNPRARKRKLIQRKSDLRVFKKNSGKYKMKLLNSK